MGASRRLDDYGTRSSTVTIAERTDLGTMYLALLELVLLHRSAPVTCSLKLVSGVQLERRTGVLPFMLGCAS